MIDFGLHLDHLVVAEVSRPHTFPNAGKAWVEPEEKDKDDTDDADDADDDVDDDDENEAWVKLVLELMLIIKSKGWQGGRGWLATESLSPFGERIFWQQKHCSLLLHKIE